MYTFTQYWLVLPVFELYTNRCGSDGKESACIAGLVSIPGLGRFPGEGNGYLLLVFLRGKFHRQRSLAGYSPWGCKESDMIEQLIKTMLLIVEQH